MRTTTETMTVAEFRRRWMVSPAWMQTADQDMVVEVQVARTFAGNFAMSVSTLVLEDAVRAGLVVRS
jgi:hypothetical protein